VSTAGPGTTSPVDDIAEREPRSTVVALTLRVDAQAA
jgi:hypothetical protein